LLEVKSVDVHYGRAQALWDVSFRVEEGEILTIIGSNGAGKSTTLKTITGLLNPTSGSIEFMGEKISELPPHEIVQRGISMIPEGRRVFPDLTVAENLKIGGYVRRNERKKNVPWVYELFPRLAERATQLAGTLSGGERQMLAVGRGLVSNPKLILFDEPSLGLAPMLVVQVFETVKRINEGGTTILLVEQNVRDSLEIADKAILLENGRVVLSGEGRELLGNEHVEKSYMGIL
jgi:branched-chain amino acid transport system ATP-binding protein